MKAKRCKNCVYAVKVIGQDKSVLICTNKAQSAGKLHLAQPDGFCRNYQIKNKKPNRPKVTQPKNSPIRFIPLTKGKIAIVDAQDYPWLSKYKWWASQTKRGFYACRKNKGKNIYMHREIMNASKQLMVDHIDGNSLNNRRSNLRLCKAVQNIANRPSMGGTSKYKGVLWGKTNKKWIARITFRGKKHYLGSFHNEIDAAKAYDKKAAELFGQFAYLNFPDIIADCQNR